MEIFLCILFLCVTIKTLHYNTRLLYGDIMVQWNGGDKVNTYKTSEIANCIGIHPNTVRLYEELELIHS